MDYPTRLSRNFASSEKAGLFTQLIDMALKERKENQVRYAQSTIVTLKDDAYRKLLIGINY